MITKYPFPSVEAATEGNLFKSRNVLDQYKDFLAKDIRASLDLNRSELTMIYWNLTHDFNKSSAIRSGNAFLIKETYIVGARKFDRRGMVGVQHIEHVFHADSIDELVDLLHDRGFKVYAVDNIMSYDPVSLYDLDFPEKSAFVMGEENMGLDDHTIALCDGMTYIEQFGSVRSLNVACAASCVMMEYNRRYRKSR